MAIRPQRASGAGLGSALFCTVKVPQNLPWINCYPRRVPVYPLLHVRG